MLAIATTLALAWHGPVLSTSRRPAIGMSAAGTVNEVVEIQGQREPLAGTRKPALRTRKPALQAPASLRRRQRHTRLPCYAAGLRRRQ
eukprot:6517636-Prymnesium_polylepis.1